VSTVSGRPELLLRRGRRLEYATLAWNVIGVVVLALAAITARSVALAGFGLDSLIEIGASTVVLWQLAGTALAEREHRAMRLIGAGFVLLVIYLIAQVGYTFATGGRPAPSPLGIVWTALTFFVMLALGSRRAGFWARAAAVWSIGWNLFGAVTFDRGGAASQYYFAEGTQQVVYQPD